MASVIGPLLHATHGSIEDAVDIFCPIVRRENQNCVVIQMLVFQKTYEPPHVVIEVCDETVKSRKFQTRHSDVRHGIFGRSPKWHVGRRGSKVAEKRLVPIPAHKLHVLFELDIGAKSFEPFPLPVAKVMIVGVVISEVIRCLPQSAATANDFFIKTKVDRS